MSNARNAATQQLKKSNKHQAPPQTIESFLIYGFGENIS
jgi:hypothetical protein